ncbi:MAG TPA: TonB-dependent receptor [Steroidobacteraceae bacterium]|jgi:outer membrane receptor protein involved in Fe transport|nr:TonB-dependent receptor [Steroidobacteraceae bacterium]
MNSQISYAVAAILAGASVGVAVDASAAEPANTGSAESGTEALQEIVVTAQRRSENMQDVPIAMQAITAESLQQLNIKTFDDYVKYLPNVTSASNGPGQNEVFMRGLSAGSQASQGSGSTGLWPNVAIYLDNQSGQLPNRNLDIYAADMNRIEVLEGPQGTLFGAGAEAGVVRYITNEPKLNVTEGNVTANYGVTAHGNPNSGITAVLNMPLIADTMAVRGVVYTDTRGGYINNVPATFTRNNTDIGIGFAYLPATGGVCPNGLPNNGFCVPPGSPTLNNYALAANNINPITYQGIRAELLYKFTDAWDLLITQSYQNMQADGVFYQQPFASDGAPLQPLNVTLFNPAYDKDKFESTAWTLNGRFGDIRAVYTGGYLVRNVEQVGDYTNYARGVYADYYQCYGPGAATNPLAPKCFSPSSTWRSVERNTHFQNELRFSTPDDWRLRGILGTFWEDNKLYDQTAWNYKNVPPCTSSGTPGVDPGNTGCLSNVGTIPGTTVQHPGVQGDHTSFYQDQVREVKQLALFASMDFDLIPKTLTLTAGTRYFRFDNSMKGSVLSSFGCLQQGLNGTLATGSPNGCYIANVPNPFPVPSFGSLYYSYNLDADHLSNTETGFRSRANLTWHIAPDVMAYYTFSQGFRPGGFNQNGGAPHAYTQLPPPNPGPGSPNVAQYIIPSSYQSDNLTNNEIGWKTEFFNHHLQWNGAIYREDWKNVQIEFFNPGVVGNLFYDTNGQNFVIKGIETSLAAQLAQGLSFQAAAAWNNSRQVNSPALLVNNPAAPGFGKPITNACNLFLFVCSPVQNPFGSVGFPSADAPPLQLSAHARYEWHLAGYVPYVQLGAFHTAHSFTQAGANPTYSLGGAVSTSRGRFENPAYSTYNASVGVAKDTWFFSVSCENLSDSNASTFISSQQFITAQTPLRPRVITGTFGYQF